MPDNIYVITDLGPGDGGKGSVIHALTNKVKPSLIIKRGGAQGSHGICTSFGDKFKFSQWGCGTFNGVPTYLSEQMVISPLGLYNESEELKRQGLYDPYVMLSAHPDCVCTTPLHTIESQLEEIKLGNNPRGTIGSGVGKAYRMYKNMSEDFTIFAKELTNREIVHRKIRKQAEYYRETYNNTVLYDCSVKDKKFVQDNLELLNDDGFLDYIEELFIKIGTKLRLSELKGELKCNGNVIVECSHGVLTDSETGLKPHVSAIRTLPKFTYDMLRDAGYEGRIINLAVHRAYEVRHGAGPVPTYDSEFTDRILPNNKAEENRWQGKIRAGALDLNLMRHGIKTSSETKFDGLCLTCFDQILADKRVWQLCSRYDTTKNETETPTEYFNRAKPIVEKLKIKEHISKDELIELIDSRLRQELGMGISMISVGCTEKEKIFNIK